MTVQFNIRGARLKLQKLVDGLRAAAGGEVVTAAAAKVQAQIDAVARSRLSKHQESGHALSVLKTSSRGGLVQLVQVAYLHFHGWWPFRNGMPPFILRRALSIFSAELLARIGRGTSEAQTIAYGISLQDEVATEKRATAAAAAFRRRAERALERIQKHKKKSEGP